MHPEDIHGLILAKYNLKPANLEIIKLSKQITHKLSHQDLFVHFIHIRVKNQNLISLDDGFWIDINDFSQFAVSRLIDRYISSEGF